MKILITGGNGNIAKIIKNKLSYLYDITNLGRTELNILSYEDVKNYLETYEIKWYEIEDKKKDVYELLVKKLKNKLDNLID
jgi:hypothetical protein